MNGLRGVRGSVLAILALLAASPTQGAPDDQALLKQAQGLFKPLPASMATSEFPVTPERVRLGRMLFFDPRISLDGTVSCSKCHQPGLYGTDALGKPIGVKDRENPRNAPTVLNAALQFAAHWRGDRKNVEDQATQALVGPPSFGNPNYDAAMAKIKAIPGYTELFRKPHETAVYAALSPHLPHTACPLYSGFLKAIEASAGLALRKDVTMTWNPPPA